MYEDRPGKAGWIIEYTTTSPSASSSAAAAASSPTAASSLILQSSQPHPSSLDKNTKEGPLLLTIVYLRSYEHMGMATVTLCSKTVITLGILLCTFQILPPSF